MEVILRTEHLSKIYETKSGPVKALGEVNLSFEKGMVNGIIGRSGSGKSTLLQILGGLDTPTEGEVIFKDKSIGAYSDREMAVFRRRHMGFVFQQYNLLEDANVKNNILMPLRLDQRKVDLQFFEEVTKLLGIETKLQKYPSELSGGEQQRVAVARAVISKPQIILADEPTGNLDKKTGEETIDLLIHCGKTYGQTLIIVTHDLEFAKKADRVIHIEDGRIIKD